MPLPPGFIPPQPPPDIPTQVLVNIRQVDELLLERLSEITHSIYEASKQGKLKTEISEERSGCLSAILGFAGKRKIYSKREATNSIANYADDFVEAKKLLLIEKGKLERLPLELLESLKQNPKIVEQQFLQLTSLLENEQDRKNVTNEIKELFDQLKQFHFNCAGFVETAIDIVKSTSKSF